MKKRTDRKSVDEILSLLEPKSGPFEIVLRAKLTKKDTKNKRVVPLTKTLAITMDERKTTHPKSEWKWPRADKWFAAHHRRSERSPVKEWLAARRQAGLKLDPKNAEIDYSYGQILDPYRIGPKVPSELYQGGRIYFARSPGSDIWVEFGDLPESTRKALWKKK